jgi:hypothetical protein
VTKGPNGAGVPAQTLQIGSGIDAAVGTFQAQLEDPTLAYLLAARSRVQVIDDTASPPAQFDGWLTARTAVPAFGQQGQATALQAAGSASMLDASIITPAISYPAGMSDQAIIQSLVSTYLVGQLNVSTYVQATNVGMPAMAFGSQTLRSAIEQVALMANGDAQGERHYYVDPSGFLHYFLTETNPAPKNISTVASGTTVAASNLQLTYDDSAIRTAVFVRGSTPAGTGWVVWGQGVAVYGWLADQLDVSDSTSLSNMLAYGWAYLAPRSVPVIRGTFDVDSVAGWAAGQTVQITNPALGLAAQSFLIFQVDRSQVSGGYATWKVAFGAKPPGIGHA